MYIWAIIAGVVCGLIAAASIIITAEMCCKLWIRIAVTSSIYVAVWAIAAAIMPLHAALVRDIMAIVGIVAVLAFGLLRNMFIRHAKTR
jgi:hypothetical protein